MGRLIDADVLIAELEKRVRTKRSTMEIVRDIIPIVRRQPPMSDVTEDKGDGTEREPIAVTDKDFICPNCSCGVQPYFVDKIMARDVHYCYYCGQKLLWEDFD